MNAVALLKAAKLRHFIPKFGAESLGQALASRTLTLGIEN
jgi:hypothetical protein